MTFGRTVGYRSVPGVALRLPQTTMIEGLWPNAEVED
ncbi:hypothetical protein Pla144_11890 [Bythopirellula polymerisocia]|uniref:Uncharacterized protein n=1 Tax=Bythopirellula polymerisocia TaxID=2528003 RepID=A0A5C6CZV1_9BACT|nr:hypothetical protein Pla144_11890 [Bythopirellula polymerisocia]